MNEVRLQVMHDFVPEFTTFKKKSARLAEYLYTDWQVTHRKLKLSQIEYLRGTGLDNETGRYLLGLGSRIVRFKSEKSVT